MSQPSAPGDEQDHLTTLTPWGKMPVHSHPVHLVWGVIFELPMVVEADGGHGHEKVLIDVEWIHRSGRV